MATEVKLFNRWSFEDVEVKDIALIDYIAVKQKYAVFLPHTAGRYNAKRFRKSQCPIVERLVCSLMMKGRNNGKKLMATRIVKHTFEIIHLLNGENPVQVRGGVPSGGKGEQLVPGDRARVRERRAAAAARACGHHPCGRVHRAGATAASRNVGTARVRTLRALRWVGRAGGRSPLESPAVPHRGTGRAPCACRHGCHGWFGACVQRCLRSLPRSLAQWLHAAPRAQWARWKGGRCQGVPRGVDAAPV